MNAPSEFHLRDNRDEKTRIISIFGCGKVTLSRIALDKRDYFRLGTISILEGLNRLAVARADKDQETQLICGTVVSLLSPRIQTFSVHGTNCIQCGLEGKFFAIERKHPYEPYHLNIYGITSFNKERMLTSDHIIPVSKGGGDDLGNRQPMCHSCNSFKKDKVNPKRDTILVERSLLRYNSLMNK
jgi:hypothetical protein